LVVYKRFFNGVHHWENVRRRAFRALSDFRLHRTIVVFTYRELEWLFAKGS
jgi:hypothetical protein